MQDTGVVKLVVEDEIWKVIQLPTPGLSVVGRPMLRYINTAPAKEAALYVQFYPMLQRNDENGWSPVQLPQLLDICHRRQNLNIFTLPNVLLRLETDEGRGSQRSSVGVTYLPR